MEFLLALFANSYRKHAAGGGIHQPKQLAVRRLNHLRRQLLRLGRSFSNDFSTEPFSVSLYSPLTRKTCSGFIGTFESIVSLAMRKLLSAWSGPTLRSSPK